MIRAVLVILSTFLGPLFLPAVMVLTLVGVAVFEVVFAATREVGGR